MKIDDQIEYVLRNMQKAWECPRCDCLWIHFNHEEQDGFYRITEDPDALCKTCQYMDKIITQNAIITGERWSDE